MPSLGVSGNTTYSQGTNYHTARNHCFRDESSYSVKAQMRMKCPGCGIWGLRGTNCKLCNYLIPGSAAIFANPKPAGRSASPGLSIRSTSAISQKSAGASPRTGTPTTGSRKPIYVQKPKTPQRVTLARVDPNSSTGFGTPKTGRSAQPRGVAKTPTNNIIRNPDRRNPTHASDDDDYQMNTYVQPVEVVFNQQAGEEDDMRHRALADAFGEVAPELQMQMQQQQQQEDPYEKQRLYHHQYQGRSVSASSSHAALSARSASGGNGGNKASGTRVKCHYCGVWVQQNKMCALCRTPN